MFTYAAISYFSLGRVVFSYLSRNRQLSEKGRQSEEKKRSEKEKENESVSTLEKTNSPQTRVLASTTAPLSAHVSPIFAVPAQ
jgi:hypothetical protein